MSVRLAIKNVVIGIPQSLVDTHDFSICNEWNSDKSACYLKTNTPIAIRVPVVSEAVVKVNQGVPPGSGSFVTFQPWLVFSKKGDTLYIFPAALNKSTAAWEYYAIDGYEEVYILFVVIDVSYKEYAQLYDKDFNLIIDRAVTFIEVEENKPLYVSDWPIVPILAIIVAGIVGGLAAWGWVKYSDAQQKYAAAQYSISQAQSKVLSKLADKLSETHDLSQVHDLVAQILAVLGITANSVQPPQSNSNDWWSKVLDWFKSFALPLAGLTGLIIILLKFNIFGEIIRMIRDIFRRRE